MWAVKFLGSACGMTIQIGTVAVLTELFSWKTKDRKAW
jgi:hypothetical protein